MEYITFFHVSDYYKETIGPRDKKWAAFWWFSDSYYSHCGLREYFYLFVKNPREEGIEAIARHGDQTFNGLYGRYLDFTKERSLIRYPEPPFLMSCNEIKPDIIARCDETDGKCTIIKPDKYKDRLLPLFREKGPIVTYDDLMNKSTNRFNEIEEIVKIIPHIKQSHPFIEPNKENGKFIYEDWVKWKRE